MTQPNQKDSKRIIVDLTMSVEEARQVMWIGRGPHEPIGKLFDSKQINSGDLAWAIDKAYSPHVRTASRTLLANWLGQPESIEVTQRYGPKVIEGSHYLEDEQDTHFALAFFQIGVFCALLFAAIIQVTLNFQKTIEIVNSSGGVLALLIVLLVFAGGLLLWVKNIKESISEYRHFRKARLGEESVVERLRVCLDNHWIIFRNIKLPNRKDDLDLVLVGPQGVWVLEVKSYGGTLRFQNGKWERQEKGKWKKADYEPSAQVRGNAQRLNDFLRREAIPIRWVETVVALTEPQPITNFEDSETPIWLLPQIEDKVKHLTTRTPPNEKEIEQIVKSLTKLVEKQIAIEESTNK